MGVSDWRSLPPSMRYLRPLSKVLNPNYYLLGTAAKKAANCSGCLFKVCVCTWMCEMQSTNSKYRTPYSARRHTNAGGNSFMPSNILVTSKTKHGIRKLWSALAIDSGHLWQYFMWYGLVKNCNQYSLNIHLSSKQPLFRLSNLYADPEFGLQSFFVKFLCTNVAS